MKKEDLKIGNRVFIPSTKQNAFISAIDGNIGVKVNNSPVFLSFDEIEPILLTDELIIKLGGEIEVLYQDAPIEAHRIKLATIKGVNLLYNHISDITPLGPYNAPVKYLHKFQNLYHALKNQELEINL